MNQPLIINDVLIRKTMHTLDHGLRTPKEEIVFTARPKIQYRSQIFRYGRSIFCLSHQPKFSYFFDLCLHWVSVVHGSDDATKESHSFLTHIPKKGTFCRLIYERQAWGHSLTTLTRHVGTR